MNSKLKVYKYFKFTMKKRQRYHNILTEQKNTLKKRRRGILKKCIELATKCDQEVMLLIHDKQEDRYIEYHSGEHLTLDHWMGLDSGITECYNNEDYDFLKKDIAGKRIYTHSDFRIRVPQCFKSENL